MNTKHSQLTVNQLQDDIMQTKLAIKECDAICESLLMKIGNLQQINLRKRYNER